MRGRKPSLTSIIAVLALAVALGGTAVAASRYIVTSTSQIKPSVLRELRREANASASSVRPAARGGHILRAVAQSTEPFKAPGPSARPEKGARLRPGAIEVPLSDASWIQHPEEVNELFGEMTVTRPSYAECPGVGQRLTVNLYVSGEWVGEEESNNAPSQTEETTVLGWISGNAEGTNQWLFPASHAKVDTIAVEATESCPEGHFTIDSITIDVLGVL
jgi:hypothetical protein